MGETRTSGYLLCLTPCAVGEARPVADVFSRSGDKRERPLLMQNGHPRIFSGISAVRPALNLADICRPLRAGNNDPAPAFYFAGARRADCSVSAARLRIHVLHQNLGESFRGEHMAEYLLFRIKDHQLVQCEKFDATSDDEALIEAEELRDGSRAELWSGVRKIRVFEADL